MNNKTFPLLYVSMLLCALVFTTVVQAQNRSSAKGRINVAEIIDTTVMAEPLDNKVNSPYIESGPILTKDGKRLYFSRLGHPKNTGGVGDQDIWFSEFDDASQSWQEAINVGPPLNNKGPNFLCGVGWKGDTVLVANVYNKNGKMSAGISISIRTGDVWSPPVAAYVGNDYNLSNRVGYDLSHDRSTLVIAEQKEDSHGRLDLYVAFRDTKGKGQYVGTESFNLGPIINSIGDESSPFLSYDDKTLFFSSSGHKGYGGEDVFMSKRLDSTWTNWSVPENLGPGINTTFDDSNFGFTSSSRYAYYSRGLSKTNSDIYRVEMTYLFNDVGFLVTEKKGKVNAVEIGQTHVIKNTFDDDQSQIKNEAMTELERVLNYLQLHQTMTVLISTHANLHNSRDESFALSNARITAVKNYLLKNGIDKSRLNYQSYGQDILVNTKDPAIKKDIASSVEFKFINYGR